MKPWHKDWRVWLPPIGFGCAFGVMYLLDHRALWLLLGVFALLELFTGYLLVRQRQTIAMQTERLNAASEQLIANSIVMSCASMNLSRARAELLHAGIEFEVIAPPEWAVRDKETLS